MEVYKAIKYIRLSYTDDKTIESDSVANQRRLIDDYIDQHSEIEAVAEKIDDGYSGVLFDRPAFQEMMDMIKRGEANCVIVKDLSRLGREYIETGRYMRRVFPAYGVRFIAINDNVDTINDAADDLTVSVKNIMNEAYCRDISVKTRSALDVKRRSGDFVGAFPVYGYFKTGDQHKSLEVDPYAADVVRAI
ncbi:MAG: recombinase family protein, partial [Ruminococcus sp.]|nr:recombinase family protein [Ruminococcus sp.]